MRLAALAAVSALITAAPTPEAQSAERKMKRIETEAAAAGSTVSFSAAELSAYAQFRSEEMAPGAVRNPRLELRDGAAIGTALIDFVKLQAAGGEPPGRLIGWLLSGERPVSVAVRVKSAGGKCQVDITRVQVSGIAIEGKALDFLIRNFLLPRYPEATIGEPFELRHRVERIEVGAGRVDVRIGP